MEDVASLVERLGGRLVGRRREIELVVAALAVDRHVLIEGPPGTGKSTLLRAVAHELGVGFEFVEGNAELTPARLVGHFDPARVLVDGYDPDVFVDGPLVTALREGSLLYVEEINRVPEETLNVLVTVMSERELHVPRLGHVTAAPGFRLVAAMNPFDAVGTARISGAIYDRVCRLAVTYQSASEEQAIAERAACPASMPRGPTKVVELVRLSRSHPDLRVGSSVRGAIDMCAVAPSLAEVRGQPVSSPSVSLDAALIALSGRVRLREGCGRTAEDVVTELWATVFGRSASGDGDGEEKLAPRLGPPALAEVAADEGRRRRRRSRGAGAQADHVAPRARPQPALRADLARRGRARRGGRRRGAGRRPRRRAARCWPTSPARPTRGFASWRNGSPGACTSTSPAAARPSHGGRVAWPSCRTGPIGATSISTPVST